MATKRSRRSTSQSARQSAPASTTRGRATANTRKNTGEPADAAIAAEEVTSFTQELATALSAGQSIVPALSALGDRWRELNPGFERIIRQVAVAVRAGEALSAALARHVAVFGQDYVDALRRSEENGTLIPVLQGLSNREEILSFEQAVRFLGTSQPTLYRLLKQGDIKGLKVGRKWRFRKADLVAHMERRPAPVTATELEGIDDELQFFAGATGRRNLQSREAQKAFNDAAGVEEAYTGESKIITLVNGILELALQRGASDIHLDPQRDGMWLRLRLDGVLHEIRRLPVGLLSPLVNRFKVMSDMSIDEKRLPQDGRIHLKWQDKNFEVRVATCPASYGESVVMRVLDQSSVFIGLDKLSFEADDLARLREWMRQPNGLVLFTGPTGSGKTTTLYSCLQEAGNPQNKVVTIEDPVELALPGMVQVNVNRKAGLTYASALRAFLRQDPDIVMVSEIPDKQVAELALEVALTGHLVLAQMNSPDAPSAVMRFIDFGVEPFLVSSSLVGVMSQRLVRRNCPDCKAEYTPPAELLARFNFDAKARRKAKFFKGRGCLQCRQTGYRGRVPIYELMSVHDEIARLIVSRASLSHLKEIARADGMTTLHESGFRKALDGVTTVEEVMRVTFTGGA